jgi:putative tricarboxylic transport membrane protein
MSPLVRAARALPYLVVAGAAVFFATETSDIAAMSLPGRIGPDAWPLLVLGFLGSVAAVGAVLAAASSPSTGRGGLSLSGLAGRDGLDEHAPDEEPPDERPSAARALFGFAAMAGFTALLGVAGFAISTFLLLLSLMWVGGFRRPLASVAAALGGTLALFFVFQRVAYMSLPMGEEPFVRVTLGLMALMGVR